MNLHFLILFPILFLQIRAEETGSIFFIDGPNHHFLRPDSAEGVVETSPMSPSDVAAAISVLLGFSPPASLSADSSSKLNEVLSPNPFNRPRAVFMLEVGGIEDQKLLPNTQIPSAVRSKALFESDKPEIHLPGKDEISVVDMNESLDSECDAVCIDKHLHDLASLLGGTYVSDAQDASNGELTVSLASGKPLTWHMSEKADKEFITSVVSLVHNIKRAIKMHEDFSRRMNSPAELMIGSFSGLKELQDKFRRDASEQGMELFLITLTKLFDSMQKAHQGQIVGVFFFNVKPQVELGSFSNVKLASRPSPRWLAESSNSTDFTAIAEIVLVRRTLAWITGIILLLSTLLGIYYLLNMPLTRDTLLYSNVKLD